MISLSAWVLVAIVLVVVALAISVGAAISRARRLDRLHQRIIASREALSRLLLRRASEASLLAQTAPFNGGGAEVMRDVARASIHDDGDQLTTDGLDRRTTASRGAIVWRSRHGWSERRRCHAPSVTHSLLRYVAQ